MKMLTLLVKCNYYKLQFEHFLCGKRISIEKRVLVKFCLFKIPFFIENYSNYRKITKKKFYSQLQVYY